MAKPVVTLNICGQSKPVQIYKDESIIDSPQLDMNNFLIRCEIEYQEKRTGEEDFLAIQIADRFTFMMHHQHCCLTVHLNQFSSRTVYITPLPLSESVCCLTEIYRSYKELL
jgi:hypothetical protein